MINAVLLYGSKARGDHDRFSDTDLLGILPSGPIKKAFDEFGVSFHLYPQDWLEREALEGSLFLLHLVSEAKVVFDPSLVFDRISSAFSYKPSYLGEIMTGCRVISAILALNEAEFSGRLRRRYFWGLRTALMAEAADQKTPHFSASALEKFSGIQNLSLHIQTRDDASFAECRRFGERVLDRMSQYVGSYSLVDRRQNLQELLASGGVGSAFGAELLYE